MILAQNAQANLAPYGVTFKEDFHTLRGDQVQALIDEAKVHRYRKPKAANGSTARYFFEAVRRKLYPATEVQWIIQGRYACTGWEDVNCEETFTDARRSLKEYRENEPGTFRMFKRRVKVTK